MSQPGAGRSSPAACASCLRRSWLLASLGPALDYHAGARDRLLELLALEDRPLLAALAGRRASELRARYERFEAQEMTRGFLGQAICRHDPLYPSTLGGAYAPPMLYLEGGLDRLQELLAGGVVAIVGSKKASDYGMETAMSLGRELSASGVTVTAGATDGIARAALSGAIQAGGRTVTVIGGGLDAAPPSWRALLGRLARSGCAVSELPYQCPPRRWAVPAGERIIAALAALTIVVEAEQSTQALAPARMASALGRGVAALPGRVTSPLSRGPHELLAEGARIVRGAGDALELLYSLGATRPMCDPVPRSLARLEPRLRRILDRVASGSDTPDKLADGEDGSEALLLALTELELLGVLARGDGGRYLPRAQ